MQRRLRFFVFLFLLAQFRISAQCNSYTVPYLQDFQSITANNQLPLCWQATNLGTSCLTFTNPGTTSNVGAFYYSPAGANYFFSPGLVLKAGVVYSVSIWYATGSSVPQNWTDLSLMIGNSPSPASMTSFTSSNGAAMSVVYKPLSGTLTVSSDGDYYIAVRATSNGLMLAQYLTWDDFAVELPCTLNAPPLTLTASESTVCAGQSMSLQASGSDTYSWSTGGQGPHLVYVPAFSGSHYITVTGTSTLSGCSKSLGKIISASPVPNLYLITSAGQVCAGQPATLNAYGATTYSWSVPGSASSLVVTPGATTVYSVTGTNQYGCSSVASMQIKVNPLPIVVIYQSEDTVCAGEPVQLIGMGGVTYTWTTPTGYGFSTPFFVHPQASGSYTLTGSDNNGCRKNDVVHIEVEECVGIFEVNSPNDVMAFPNPCPGALFIKNGGSAKLELFDVTGRRQDVPIIEAEGDLRQIEMSTLECGVYFLKITLNERTKVLTVIREKF